MNYFRTWIEFVKIVHPDTVYGRTAHRKGNLVVDCISFANILQFFILSKSTLLNKCHICSGFN